MENIAIWCILEVVSCKCKVCCELKKKKKVFSGSLHFFFSVLKLSKFLNQCNSCPPLWLVLENRCSHWIFFQAVFTYVLIWRTNSWALGTIKDAEKGMKYKFCIAVSSHMHLSVVQYRLASEKNYNRYNLSGLHQNNNPAAWLMAQRWGHVQGLCGS